MDIFEHSVIDRFRDADGAVLGPWTPANLGQVTAENPADYCEVDFLLRSVIAAGSRFRMLSLGASPGEWAIRAERAFLKLCPDGDYMSVNVEADPSHIRIMEDYFRNNKASFQHNVIVYGAVTERDGWATLPIVHHNHWGAGVVSFSKDGHQPAGIDLPDHIRASYLTDTGSDELGFRSVMGFSLDTLLNRIGAVDFLHCDIQGAEADIFPPHMNALAKLVKVCCISVHSSAIAETIRQTFAREPWTLNRDIPGLYLAGPHGEETHKDGVLIYSNGTPLL